MKAKIARAHFLFMTLARFYLHASRLEGGDRQSGYGNPQLSLGLSKHYLDDSSSGKIIALVATNNNGRGTIGRVENRWQARFEIRRSGKN